MPDRGLLQICQSLCLRFLIFCLGVNIIVLAYQRRKGSAEELFRGCQPPKNPSPTRQTLGSLGLDACPSRRLFQ